MDKKLMQILINYLDQDTIQSHLVIYSQQADESIFENTPFRKEEDYWVISKKDAIQLVKDEVGITDQREFRDFDWLPLMKETFGK